MPNYIINKVKDKKDLKNEIHNVDYCTHLPSNENRVPLGTHADAKKAKSYAKSQGWVDADGCFFCCKEAHNY